MVKGTRKGRPPHDDVLTPAEWRTVHAVQHGMTNREIAQRRGISLDAVKFHVANALGKLALANRQALRTWFRAPKDSALERQLHRDVPHRDFRWSRMPRALERQDKSMNEPFRLGPIGQISRSVRDIRQAEAWYGTVLGLPHLYTFGKLAFFDCGGTRLFLAENASTQNENSLPGESILYLRVADIEQAHNTLKARGVEFTNAPHLIHRHADGTEEWMAFFKDPEGRPLALMSQVKS